MDLSFVVNAYSCIVYITSYILKDESNLSELLMDVVKETADCSVKEQLQKLGSCFLTHRELSAQEAVYRLLSFPMKHSTNTVIFVNAGPPDSRVSVLRPRGEIEGCADEDEDIFCTNVLDRYAARPTQLDKISLAEFAAYYKPCSSSDKGDDVISLVNNSNKFIGCMKKRKKMCIIRYPKFKDDTDTFFR